MDLSEIFYYKTKIVQQLHRWLDRIFGLKKKRVLEVVGERGLQDPYKWRGLMVDVARHMPSLPWLYKTIDRMQELRLNKLHLHLSDDQGFRVEIKKYPRLQEVAAWRAETAVGKNFPTPWSPFTEFIGDGKRYGGYYTQEELKKLVAYARSKGVEIIPEIDIPGHVTAVLVAYPQYAAGTAPQTLATYWGVFDNVVDDRDEAIKFLKNIFDEVCEVFDSRYVHIGGDEVSLKNYKGDERRPKKILEEVARHLIRKGKKVIMWDEAAELALETDSIIMAWHSVEMGLEYLRRGGEVIFCPTSHCYFDFYQGDPNTEPLAIGGYLPLETVRSFRISDDIRRKYGDRVLGVQANLWTEYMPTEAQMDYMLYPRLNAFAEIAKGR